MENRLISRPLLYSTVTELAYRIAQKYYNEIHYVWCTSSFDALLQPGSSNPRTLCNRYLDQIIKADSHAVEIDNNKAGILKGAKHKFDSCKINQHQYDEITGIVKYSKMEDFYPVIFLIHKRSAKNRSKKVLMNETASNISEEYIIEDLKRSEFEFIRVKSILMGVIDPQW